jgi:hypothetical protein
MEYREIQNTMLNRQFTVIFDIFATESFKKEYDHFAVSVLRLSFSFLRIRAELKLFTWDLMLEGFNQPNSWNRVFLGKQISPQLVTKFPKFYGTQRFFAVSTRKCPLSLSRLRLIQYTPTHHIFFKIHFNITLPRSKDLPSCLFTSHFATKIS